MLMRYMIKNSMILVAIWFFFLSKSFKFQPNVCNRCYDLIIMSINLSDNAILNIKSADYCCIISRISKTEVINLMQKVNLTVK